MTCFYHKEIKQIYAKRELHFKKIQKHYISMLSLIFGEVDAQIADGFLDFLDFNSHIAGEFLLVLDDLIDEKLQLPDQIDRKHQGKSVIRDEFEHVFNIQ